MRFSFSLFQDKMTDDKYRDNKTFQFSRLFRFNKKIRV